MPVTIPDDVAQPKELKPYRTNAVPVPDMDVDAPAGKTTFALLRVRLRNVDTNAEKDICIPRNMELQSCPRNKREKIMSAVEEQYTEEDRDTILEQYGCVGAGGADQPGVESRPVLQEPPFHRC